jgi:hypothetical protein
MNAMNDDGGRKISHDGLDVHQAPKSQTTDKPKIKSLARFDSFDQ